MRPPPNGVPATSPNAAQQSSSLPPYGRTFSPPTEIRPIREDRPVTPGSAYHQQSYHHPQYSGIANGAPPPAAAMAAAEAAARDRDERGPSPVKRSREWEADAPSKKAANDETRARLDEFPARRPSPPSAMTAPADHYRRSSSEVRRENERRANENYHPSEAAHHPYAAPGPVSSVHNILEAPKEERKEPVENAARKVDVDEDYDNSEDDKRAPGTRSSPQTSSSVTIPKQEVVV